MKTYKNKLIMAGVSLVLVLLMLGLPLGTLAAQSDNEAGEYIYQWNGNGKDSIDCNKAGEGERPDDDTGWIHWVFTSKGDSTDALLTLGGSGNGSYSPGEPLEANVWHFYTPYFDVYELTASVTLLGGIKGPGTGLVISDYCPGIELEETGSIVIEKLVKLDVDDEEVIPSNKTFIFNIYNHETDELVLGGIELEVVNGEGSITIDNLALGLYRVEEVINGGYLVTLDPEDGVVDLTTAEENTVTVIVTNTPRPELVIEKVLLNTEGVPVGSSNVEFTVILDGGLFDEEEITFSVNEPAVLKYTEGLEFDVTYTVTEVVHGSYTFVSIEPGEEFLLTAENNKITVTIVNREISTPPQGPNPPPVPPVIPPESPTPPPVDPVPPVLFFVPPVPPQVIVIPPAEPQVTPPPPTDPPLELPQPVGGVDEEEEESVLIVVAEQPRTEPDEKEEVVIIEPAAPLATPQTGGPSVALVSLSLILLGSGVLLKKQFGR